MTVNYSLSYRELWQLPDTIQNRLRRIKNNTLKKYYPDMRISDPIDKDYYNLYENEVSKKSMTYLMRKACKYVSKTYSYLITGNPIKLDDGRLAFKNIDESYLHTIEFYNGRILFDFQDITDFI